MVHICYVNHINDGKRELICWRKKWPIQGLRTVPRTWTELSFLEMLYFGLRVIISAWNTKPTFVDKLPFQLGSSGRQSALEQSNQWTLNLIQIITESDIFFLRNFCQTYNHAATSHSTIIIVTYFSCNRRWFGFKV